MSNLLALPRDVLFLMLSQLDITALSRICSSSKNFEAICKDPRFWAFKYTQDFNEPFPNNVLETAKRVYLRRWTRDLDELSGDLLQQLKLQIRNIFISASKKDQIKQMEQAYEYVIDRLLKPVYVDPYTLKDLKNFLEGHPEDLLLDVAEELGQVFYDNNITELNGVELVSVTQGDNASDEEIAIIDKLFKEVVEALFHFEIKMVIINYRLDTLFKNLATNPFEPYSYEYMVMSSVNEFENEQISRYPRHYLNYYNPSKLNKGLVPPHLPANLPPPPPRAPLLSKLTLPPPLQRDFPLPGHGPAPPGSLVPPNLPPPPPQLFEEKGILWWERISPRTTQPRRFLPTVARPATRY